MQRLEQLRTIYKNQILSLAAQYGAYNIRIFGSLARGEDTPQSDIDFLVCFEPQRSLFDQGGLLMDLQDLLNCKVDVVDENAMRPRFQERVLKEAVPL
jgi:uncharacterized protein